MYSGAGHTPALPQTNFHAAMVGKGAFEKYAGGVNKSTVLGAGGFGAGGLLGANKDGSGTERQTYHYGGLLNQLGAPAKEDKSFTSPGGTHGAVSALNLAGVTGNDNSYLMKNILSTPSSGKSKSGISQEDALDLQK